LGFSSLTPTYRKQFGAADAQNKKYLCAIGNSFAGSQVSKTPSALTSYVCASISIVGR
jgi:hypothetical protein